MKQRPQRVSFRSVMKENSLLFMQRLPARLNVDQVGEVLGFLSHEITVLMNAGLLKPLGRPAANGHKFFCAKEILDLSENREWLDKATRSITRHWQDRNRNQKEAKLPV
jgi:hypothetical protein